MFLKFILIKYSIRFGPIYCPSSAVSTLYTAIGICHASYVDSLLARSGCSILTSLADCAVYTALRLLMMDSRSVRNM